MCKPGGCVVAVGASQRGPIDGRGWTHRYDQSRLIKLIKMYSSRFVSFAALHVAAAHGLAKIVSLLTAAGADVTIADVWGITPTMLLSRPESS